MSFRMIPCIFLIIFVFRFSSAGITDVGHHSWLLKWVLGLELGTLCLQSKHFIN